MISLVLFAVEGEEAFEFFLVGLAAVFAKFERFGVTDGLGFVGAVPIAELAAKTFEIGRAHV